MELVQLFSSAWNALDTPITLPWIGTTSPLWMGIFLGVLGIVVDFVNRSWGGGTDD